MVASKYGSSDPDLRSRKGSKGKTKEISDGKLPGAGSKPELSALVGGVVNAYNGKLPNSKKSGPRGSVTRST
jgi:hypothetical protein